MPRPLYGVVTPGSSRTGRTFAYVSNSLRSVTFALFSPNPTGGSSGPFNTTRVRSIDSIVSGGTPEGSPFLKTSAPASCSSQSIFAPVAWTIRWAARTHSGPIPSPGMSVTWWVAVRFIEAPSGAGRRHPLTGVSDARRRRCRLGRASRPSYCPRARARLVPYCDGLFRSFGSYARGEPKEHRGSDDDAAGCVVPITRTGRRLRYAEARAGAGAPEAPHLHRAGEPIVRSLLRHVPRRRGHPHA